jgi:hypothetical protein
VKMGYGPTLGLGIVTGAAALFLSGCDVAQEPEYGAVCVQESTGNRLPDDACGDADDEGHSHSPGMIFLWMGSGGGYVPPVGQRVAPGSGPLPKSYSVPGMVRSVPKGAPTAKGLSSTGGQVQRGGLGQSGAKAGTSGSGAKMGGSGGS